MQALEDKTPLLGICLGMQLLADKGYEFGQHDGLGLIACKVVKLETHDERLRLPHVGWNEVVPAANSKLFKNIGDKNFYFVHSYHFACVDKKIISSICEYGPTSRPAWKRIIFLAPSFIPKRAKTAAFSY